FLRSPRSLIQTIGRAARNINGEVIMYADRVTAAMKHAMDETNRRRVLQEAYNVEHGITPATVVKAILDLSPTSGARDYYAVSKGKPAAAAGGKAEEMDLADRIEAVRQEMFAAAERLEFEKAARLRDQLRILKGEGGDGASNGASGASAAKGMSKGGRGAEPKAARGGGRRSAAGGRGRGMR